MIMYMLGKLATEAGQCVALQKEGNFPTAHSGYELICEALRYYHELGYRQKVAEIHRMMLEAQPSPALTLYFHALILFHLRKFPSAAEAVEAALLLEPELALLHVLKARIQTSLGDLPTAMTAYQKAQTIAPTSGGA